MEKLFAILGLLALTANATASSSTPPVGSRSFVGRSGFISNGIKVYRTDAYAFFQNGELSVCVKTDNPNDRPPSGQPCQNKMKGYEWRKVANVLPEKAEFLGYEIFYSPDRYGDSSIGNSLVHIYYVTP